MVLTYTCIRKCFFLDGIRNPGDKLILDSSVGDECCHLVRTPTEEQLAMQAEAQKEEQSTEAPAVPKAVGAKVVSTRKKSNGSKKA